MPKRFIKYSRTEPARTILWAVAMLTGIIQVGVTVATGGLGMILNGLLVASICGWGVWSSTQNNVRHMSMSSFWLFMMWLWSGLQVALVATHTLLWAPMLVVAVTLSVTYIYLSHQRKGGIDE